MPDTDAYHDTTPSAYARTPTRPSARVVGPEPVREAHGGAGLHVMLLVVALPVIGTLAATVAWIMGGTFWQIVRAAIAAWLLVQLVYFMQLVLRYLRARDTP